MNAAVKSSVLKCQFDIYSANFMIITFHSRFIDILNYDNLVI
jgi:hypothetical protein